MNTPELDLIARSEKLSNLASKLAGQVDEKSKYFNPVEAKKTMALIFDCSGEMDFADLPMVEDGEDYDLRIIREEQMQANVYEYAEPLEN